MGVHSILYFLLFVSNAFAFICTPPIIVDEPPASLTVSLGQFQDAGFGVVANLVLPCGVIGTPVPTVSWFYGERPFFGIISVNTLSDAVVLADGTLALNVTEELIDRDGTNFYCVATNQIGNITATLRSRNVNVTRMFFDGFAAATPNDISLETVEGGSVALLCDILQGIPTPAIQWFADGVLVEENLNENSIHIVDNGRYLFIRQLTAAQRNARFHCSVTTFEGEVLRDPNTYILSNDISNPNFITQYSSFLFPMVTADIGEPVTLIYSAAAVDQAGNSIDLSLSCPILPELTLSVSNSLVITAILQPSALNLQFPEVLIQCTLNNGLFGTVLGILHVSIPPVVLFPIPGVGPNDTVIMDRERLVNSGPVVYSCASSDQSDRMSTRWFFNNLEITISGFLGATFPDPETLLIPNPQVINSGIYQCFVTDFSNNFELTRAWFLEVREFYIHIHSSIFKSYGISNVYTVPTDDLTTVAAEPVTTTRLSENDMTTATSPLPGDDMTTSHLPGDDMTTATSALPGDDMTTTTSALPGDDMTTATSALPGDDTTTSPLSGDDMTTATSSLPGDDTTTSPLSGDDMTTATSSLPGDDMTTSPLSGDDMTTSPLSGDDMTTSPLSGDDMTTATSLLPGDDMTTSPLSGNDMATTADANGAISVYRSFLLSCVMMCLATMATL